MGLPFIAPLSPVILALDEIGTPDFRKVMLRRIVQVFLHPGSLIRLSQPILLYDSGLVPHQVNDDPGLIATVRSDVQVFAIRQGRLRRG